MVLGIVVVVLVAGVVAVLLRPQGDRAPAPDTPPPPATAVAAPSPPVAVAAPDDLAASFAEVEQQLGGVVGVAVAPLGGGPVTTLGTWTTGPAWSTSKVPLVMAALREEPEPVVSPAMRAAIVDSDNDSAEAVWEGLGSSEVAARKVEAVLRDGGDETTAVESRKVRPEYSAFGQTVWSLSDQVRFLSRAACDGRAAPVLSLMGDIASGQRWGLGTIADARFKGGWGPSREGNYLVRQVGVLTIDRGDAVVALAVEPGSGGFGDGTAMLTDLAGWLATRLGDLPVGRCPG